MDETVLVKRAREGDNRALAQLLQENYKIVFGYLLKVTLDKTLAEDITQDTMVRAIERLHQYRGESKFSSWLISMATNIYRDQLRRGKAAARAAGQLSADRSDPDGGNVESQLILRQDVQSALLELALEKRIALVLKYFYDYSYEEISAAMKVPVGTVRSRLHNGIKNLKALMGSTIAAVFCWGL